MSTWPTSRIWGRTAVAVVAAALAVAGCTGSDGATSPSGSSPDQDPPAATSTADATGGETEPVEIDLTDVASTVDAFVAEEQLSGAGLVVVQRDDGVIGEYYSGDFDGDRISLLASSSKMLTAGVLSHLADEGVLDLDAPVPDVVAWGTGNPDVTPAQLLSNSSGLAGLVDGPTFPPYICQYVATGTISECAKQIFTTPDDDDRVTPPDEKFRYGGAQWQVAGAVAEAASGQSWSELIDETYVEPCGLDSLGYNNHYAQITSDDGPFSYPTQFAGDPTTLADTENPNMEGGAYASPNDYSKLLLMQLRGGMCDDERVLSEAAVERMQTDRVGPAYDADLSATLGGGNPASAEQGRTLGGYGLGWWVGADDPDYVEDAGAFGAVPWLDLGRGYGAYLVIESTSQQGRTLANKIRPAIEEQIDAEYPG